MIAILISHVARITAKGEVVGGGLFISKSIVEVGRDAAGHQREYCIERQNDRDDIGKKGEQEWQSKERREKSAA